MALEAEKAKEAHVFKARPAPVFKEVKVQAPIGMAKRAFQRQPPKVTEGSSVLLFRSQGVLDAEFLVFQRSKYTSHTTQKAQKHPKAS